MLSVSDPEVATMNCPEAVVHVRGGDANTDRVRAGGADDGEGAVVALGESGAHTDGVAHLQRKGRGRVLGDGDLVVGGRGGSSAQVEVGEGLGGQRRHVEAGARRIGLGVGGPLGHVLDGGDAAGGAQDFFGALSRLVGRVLVLGDDDRAAAVLAVDAGGQARGHRRHDDEGDDDEGRGDGDGQAGGDVAAAVGAQVCAQERVCCRHEVSLGEWARAQRSAAVRESAVTSRRSETMRPSRHTRTRSA